VVNSVAKLWGAVSIVATALTSAALAVPTITNITPRSLAVGGTTMLTIEGADLAPRPRILLSVPIERQEVKPGGTANRVQIEVKLPPSIAAGIRSLRVAADTGISGPVPVAIDDLTAVPFTSALSNLPAAVYGELTGGTVVRTSFHGMKGQRIVAEIESRRLGSGLNPIVRLLNDRGVQIAWADQDAALAGDARLDTRLPADGEYTVELHDALFRGGTPGMFRLKLGTLHYADLTLPLAVERGTVASLELVRANLWRTAAFDAKGLPLGARLGPFCGDSPSLHSSPRLMVSDHAEIVEPVASADGPSAAPGPPIGISGRLSSKGEEDRFRIPVTPGAVLRFDVLAERVGSPLDAVLSIRNEQGQQLAGGDDRPGTTDSGLDFTVPGSTSALVLAIRDLHGRGGRNFVYRLSVKPTSHSDFNLALPQDTIHVPRGGRTAVRVQATRQGHSGAIVLEDVGLPPGVESFPRDVAARADAAIVVFEAKPGASGQAVAQLHGRASYSSSPRPALAPQSSATAARPWERAELGIAVTAPAPCTVDWTDGIAARAHQGQRWPASVRVNRSAGTAGPIRLTLLTTQTIPKKNQNNQQVDDVARSLRLAEGVTIPADQSQGKIDVVVPGDLPMIGYDLVVQADLLSPDAKQTIATSYTRPHRLAIIPPPKAPEPK
jgi:hypothetical protein